MKRDVDRESNRKLLDSEKGEVILIIKKKEDDKMNLNALNVVMELAYRYSAQLNYYDNNGKMTCIFRLTKNKENSINIFNEL